MSSISVIYRKYRHIIYNAFINTKSYDAGVISYIEKIKILIKDNNSVVKNLVNELNDFMDGKNSLFDFVAKHSIPTDEFTIDMSMADL